MRMNEELQMFSSSTHVRPSSDFGRKKNGTMATTVSRPSSTDDAKYYFRTRTSRKMPSKDQEECFGSTNDEKGSERSSKSEIIVLKPGKHPSSPAFRIQVTVHRPLSWQLSSSSTNSSICVPRRRRRVRRSESSPNNHIRAEELEKNENGWEEDNYIRRHLPCEGKCISMLSPSASLDGRRKKNLYTAFKLEDFDCSQIMNSKCDEDGKAERKSRSRRRHPEKTKRIPMRSGGYSSAGDRATKPEEQSADYSGSSSSEDEKPCGSGGSIIGSKQQTHRFKRIRKRGSSDFTPQQQHIPENEENENPCERNGNNSYCSCEHPRVFHRQFSLKISPPQGAENGEEELERSYYHYRHRRRRSNKRKQQQQQLNGTESLTLQHGRTTTESNNNESLESHPSSTVMTWFRQTDTPVHKKSGMGASGSTQGGGGRLKSRSQSSSALYCIKANNNGQLGPVDGSSGLGHRRHLHSSTGDYTNLAYHHHQGNNALSSSIPADLWDLAPTTKSFSPITRKHSRPHLEHQQSAEYPSEVESKNQKNKHRPFPFVDAFIHRASEKHKKGKGRAGSSGSGSGSGREKFYAVSCPDVAQEANNSSFRGSSFSGSQHRVNVNNPDYGYSSGRSTAVYESEDIAAAAAGRGGGGTSSGNNNNFKPLRSSSSSCRGHPHHHHHCHNQHHHHRHSHNHQQQPQLQQPPQYPSAAYQNSSSQTLHQYEDDRDYDSRQTPITFPFITEADIFEIRLIRDHRGLGLSVTGGRDSQESYPGLIRIKKVFPMSPAFQSGRLRPWDIILKANGVPLTGLTNHEALEVLRTTPVETILTVCRPPAFIPGFHILEQSNNSQSQPALTKLHSPSYEDPYQEEQFRRQQLLQQQLQQQLLQNQIQQQQQQQQKNHQSSSSSNPSAIAFNPSAKSKSLSSLKIPTSQQQHSSQNYYGEFEVTLEKLNGSLGFTLRQEDTSILGHYVRALVKDPALSDGRIQPGDRILSVNGYDLSGVSHADAIAFLRQCPPKVTLRLYRDVSPTPISPLSPTESHRSKKNKPLRQEAIDMLNDLALRKKMSGSEPKSSLAGSAVVGRTGGLRSLSKQLSSQDAVDAAAASSSPTPTPPNGPATLPRRRHGLGPGVTPSPEVLSAALDRFAGRATTPKSGKSQSPESVKSSSNLLGAPHNYPSEARSSGSGESTPAGTITQSRNKTDRRLANNDEDVDDDEQDNGENRPKGSVSSESSLDLGPSSRNRRPSFRQYTLHLDRISSIEDDSFSSDLNQTDSIVSEPGLGFSPSHASNFRHGQPAYQSAILPSTTARPGGVGKKTKRSKDDSDKCSAGRESPTTMSDIDAPSCNKTFASSKSSLLESQQMTRQANESGGSVHEGSVGSSAKASTSKSGGTGGGSSNATGGGLLKWKGVVFSPESAENENKRNEYDEDGEDDLESSATSTLSLRDTHPGSSSSNLRDQRKLWSKQEQSSDNDEGDEVDYDEDYDDDDRTEPLDTSSKSLPQRRSSPDGREFHDCDTMEVTSSTTDCNGEQIFTVQLNRRWCSRLGFSLQGSNGHTFISAIYPDSVAAKDGRLRVGDEIIMVNNETIRDMDTARVIDTMRKTRGAMNITILRKPARATSESDNNLTTAADSADRQ